MHAVNGALHFYDRIGQRLATFKCCQQCQIFSLLLHAMRGAFEDGQSFMQGEAITILQVRRVRHRQCRFNGLLATCFDFGDYILVERGIHCQTADGRHFIRHHQRLLQRESAT